MTNEQIIKKAINEIKGKSDVYDWFTTYFNIIPEEEPLRGINMKNEQILKRAIEKAIKGGYFISDDKIPGYLITVNCNHYYRLIFSHDFVKAFWGEEYRGSSFGIKNWEHNLQQMVLEEEPLKYLEKFL